MAPAHRASAIAVDRLGPQDLIETFAFLDQDPILNVYLVALTMRDALGRPRDETWGARRDGRMVGLLHLGGRSGAMLPVGEDAEAMRLLGDQARLRLPMLPRRFQLVGSRAAVDPFLSVFARTGLRPRLARAQVYMDLIRAALPAFERLPELTPAGAADLPVVYESGALLRAEELDEDPRTADPEGYRQRVAEECRDGHTFLWRGPKGLLFRASVSAITADAAQVSGVYTPREHRNQGVARRGLAELCTRLFERTRSVCLFVNDRNVHALALYRRLGFRPRAAWRSLFYDLGA